MVKRSDAANEANVMPGMHSPRLAGSLRVAQICIAPPETASFLFPFSEARAMLDRLASRQVAGKLILAVNPS